MAPTTLLTRPSERTTDAASQPPSSSHTGLLVRHPQPGAAVIELPRELTGASEDDLRLAAAHALAERPTVLVLDFRPMQYLNSGGVGQLATLLVRANRARCRLVAFGLTEPYREILSLTRLDEAIGVHATERGALAAAGAAR